MKLYEQRAGRGVDRQDWIGDVERALRIVARRASLKAKEEVTNAGERQE